ncbi:MAG: hypothetical protein L0229_02530 [Blastocatellia bacterium]|nr:hypothetical protein [Blastocatellia bacterium]
MKTHAICTDAICDRSIAERPRYYARQLITDVDMNLEQRYFIDRFRRHNRLLHGYGVLCGAQVCPIPTGAGRGFLPWKVLVKPGYILGPYGDEIIIDCDRTVDLRTSGVSGVTGEPCIEPVDPWCSEVFIKESRTGSLFVAVKYKEVVARPVRAQPVGCGCDDTQCEYSRLRDGYEIGILNCCPESHVPAHKPKDHARRAEKKDEPCGCKYLPFEHKLADCPPCPEEPWVVLAEIELGTRGEIEKIDNCSCRRIVASLSHAVSTCESKLPSAEKIDPDSIAAGEKTKAVTITGTNLKAETRIDLGQGITIDYDTVVVEEDGTVFKVKIDAGRDAVVGPRALTLINPDCSTTTLADKFRVQPAASDAEEAEKPAPKQAASTATKSKKRTSSGKRTKAKDEIEEV